MLNATYNNVRSFQASILFRRKSQVARQRDVVINPTLLESCGLMVNDSGMNSRCGHPPGRIFIFWDLPMGAETNDAAHVYSSRFFILGGRQTNADILSFREIFVGVDYAERNTHTTAHAHLRLPLFSAGSCPAAIVFHLTCGLMVDDDGEMNSSCEDPPK